MTNDVGIPASPILAPSRDLFGQLRVDDPAATPPPGLGTNVFKDRGALDRADFVGPVAQLYNPLDNDGRPIQDPSANSVLLSGKALASFSVQLLDLLGAGIDDSTVTQGQFTLTRDGITLTPVIDYLFSYDTTNNIARFDAAPGVWINGTYKIVLDNSPTTGIRDIAANPLTPNLVDGTTTFTIVLNNARSILGRIRTMPWM